MVWLVWGIEIKDTFLVEFITIYLFVLHVVHFEMDTFVGGMVPAVCILGRVNLGSSEKM